jgi:hypothetical protein
MTFNKMTFSVTTLNDAKQKDAHHNTQSFVLMCCYYAKCHFADCRGTQSKADCLFNFNKTKRFGRKASTPQ